MSEDSYFDNLNNDGEETDAENEEFLRLERDLIRQSHQQRNNDQGEIAYDVMESVRENILASGREDKELATYAAFLTVQSNVMGHYSAASVRATVIGLAQVLRGG